MIVFFNVQSPGYLCFGTNTTSNTYGDALESLGTFVLGRVLTIPPAIYPITIDFLGSLSSLMTPFLNNGVSADGKNWASDPNNN
jgi:hypothetical protein